MPSIGQSFQLYTGNGGYRLQMSEKKALEMVVKPQTNKNPAPWFHILLVAIDLYIYEDQCTLVNVNTYIYMYLQF